MSPTPRGQVLVIVALMLVVLIGMVAVVVDGGFAWAQQRDAQNASDAAAEAGAVVLAQRLASVLPLPGDAEVASKFDAVIAANDVSGATGYYTNLDGSMLTAAGGTTTVEADGAEVGGGTIPPGASGVSAVSEKTFDTFFAGVLGFDEMTTTADATAVAGYVTDVCSADQGCNVLPVTFPVTITTCDGNNDAAPTTIEWELNTADPYVVPLCRHSPGNVGWIDWTPPGGGASELSDSIRNPNNPPIDLPSWQQVSEPGNTNSTEDAMRTWDGQVVMIPLFDSTCSSEPTNPDLSGCPADDVGGHGARLWYHFPKFAAFQLCDTTLCGPDYAHGAYIQGSNPDECDTGNGATSCLVGRFVSYVTTGTVGPPPSGDPGVAAIGVQLID
jgi:hypothetical protein